ncbi:MAG TPA: hypothetical protein VGY53_09365 [Isosphaeraceae bacterium]|nr:hypothetical protein [Isosphaeraceae bacterium]
MAIVRLILRPLKLTTPLLGVILLGQVASAQEPDADPFAEVEAGQPELAIDEASFDRWVFGQLQNAAMGQRWWDSLLVLRIDEIDRLCHLTAEQKKKLKLAGRGDFKHLLDRVEEKRRSFRLIRSDRKKLRVFFKGLRPIQLQAQSGVFGEGSFFAKTLKRTLDAQQYARCEEAAREQKLFHYQASVEMAIAILETSVPMTTAQRRQLVKVIENEIPPPRTTSQHDYYTVLRELSRLQAKVKPIFEESQGRRLSEQFAQLKGIGEALRENGFLGEEPIPAAADRADPQAVDKESVDEP